MKSVIILLLNSILFFISANMLAQEKNISLNTHDEVIPAQMLKNMLNQNTMII